MMELSSEVAMLFAKTSKDFLDDDSRGLSAKEKVVVHTMAVAMVFDATIQAVRHTFPQGGNMLIDLLAEYMHKYAEEGVRNGTKS